MGEGNSRTSGGHRSHSDLCVHFVHFCSHVALFPLSLTFLTVSYLFHPSHWQYTLGTLALCVLLSDCTLSPPLELNLVPLSPLWYFSILCAFLRRFWPNSLVVIPFSLQNLEFTASHPLPSNPLNSPPFTSQQPWVPLNLAFLSPSLSLASNHVCQRVGAHHLEVVFGSRAKLASLLTWDTSPSFSTLVDIANMQTQPFRNSRPSVACKCFSDWWN